jgi:hypothetical protein
MLEIFFPLLRKVYGALHVKWRRPSEGANIKEESMKIELEGTLIKMTPENDREKEELNQLWTIVIGCVSEGKKLVPVGQYIPGSKEVALFNIE